VLFRLGWLSVYVNRLVGRPRNLAEVGVLCVWTRTFSSPALLFSRIRVRNAGAGWRRRRDGKSEIVRCLAFVPRVDPLTALERSEWPFDVCFAACSGEAPTNLLAARGHSPTRRINSMLRSSQRGLPLRAVPASVTRRPRRTAMTLVALPARQLPTQSPLLGGKSVPSTKPSTSPTVPRSHGPSLERQLLGFRSRPTLEAAGSTSNRMKNDLVVQSKVRRDAHPQDPLEDQSGRARPLFTRGRLLPGEGGSTSLHCASAALHRS